MAEEVSKRTQDPLAEKIRELEEAKRILEDTETKALSGVAMALTEAAESLSHTAKDLAHMRTAEWMTAEQAATYLGCESVKAFEKIATREGIRSTISRPAPHGIIVLSLMPGLQDAEATDDTLSNPINRLASCLQTTPIR